MIITRVAPASAAKVAGVLYAVLGFLVGGVISLAVLAGSYVAASQSEVGPIGALFGVGAVILLPIFYGCLGFVMTLVMTWLFNIVVGITGGIEVDAR